MNALTTNQIKKLQTLVSLDNSEKVRSVAFVAFMLVTKQSLKQIKVNAKSSGLESIAQSGSFKELHHNLHAVVTKMALV